jgi:asparagine synthase (glutamine-hydrolysing)
MTLLQNMTEFSNPVERSMPSFHQLIFRLRRRLFPVDLSSELSPEDLALLNSITQARLTCLSRNKLSIIAARCRAISEESVPGLFIEAGCALGGSAIMVSKIKRAERPFKVYDVFGMIPAPSDKDGEDVHQRYLAIERGESQGVDGDKYYGYEENLYEKVRANFESFGVRVEESNVALIKGLVQDTMKIDEPIAFAHIDVDWYDPVLHCLEQIVPNLSVGGSIVVDDYYDWSGCRKATCDFFKRNRVAFSKDSRAGSISFTRIS